MKAKLNAFAFSFLHTDFFFLFFLSFLLKWTWHRRGCELLCNRRCSCRHVPTDLKAGKKVSRWGKTDICRLQWLHPHKVAGSNPQIHSVLELNNCVHLTCCREWKWQENSSCLSAIVYVCCVCAPSIKGWDVVVLGPPPVVVAPVRTPWPSHRHTGSKRGPL